MAHDFAKKPRAKTKRRKTHTSKVPGWVWLFTGTVLGAFIMFLMHLAEQIPLNNKTIKNSKHQQAQKTPKPEATKPATKPRFDFYRILKEAEVIIPRSEESQAYTEPKTDNSAEYILQVGSFKKSADAEQLRVELLLLNLQAQTETAKLRNGETWHRVLVGPFTSRSKLAKARSILVSNRLEALVLKRSMKKAT